MKNGRELLSDGTVLQRYRCKGCRKCFNDRTGSPMARLRTPSSVVATALNGRSERLGVRATGRLFGASHSTILRREERLARQAAAWSPPAPADREVTLEGDEVYIRVGENLPPPLAPRGGLFTLLNARAATGSQRWPGTKMNC